MTKRKTKITDSVGVQQDHSTRQHAILAASSSSRWLNCTPSARLEAEMPEGETSKYAEEGTLAHELNELFVRNDLLHNISAADFSASLDHLISNDLFKEEMNDCASIYLTYLTENLNEAKMRSKFALLLVEQKLDLTEYVPESFGTSDALILSDDLMEVIDYKHGKGIPVYAKDNNQMMLYALGALLANELVYDIHRIRMTIIQPRLDNISSWEITKEDLMKWANETLKDRAQMAFKGVGIQVSGAWCRFCKVRNRCKVLADEQLQLTKYEFSRPDLLTDDEIADILKRVPMLQTWATSIFDYALAMAEDADKEWPGFKLVNKRSRRVLTNEEAAIQHIQQIRPDLTAQDLYNLKLKSLTDLEKVLGGKPTFNKEMAPYIIQSEPGHTLVSIDDSRPSVGSGLEQARRDFTEPIDAEIL